MDVNFIITVYDKEEYLPYLLEILNSYKKIKPTYTIAYTGNNCDFPCNVKLENRGHSRGDYDCIVHGYLNAKNKAPQTTRFIKIGVDSWLLNEDVILDIFHKMELEQAGYGGIWWDSHQDDISTDIFFVDTRFGNAFDVMIQNDVPDHLTPRLELYMRQILDFTKIKIHLIMDRWPSWSQFRWSCEKLGWTMSHNLEENIKFKNNYNK